MSSTGPDYDPFSVLGVSPDTPFEEIRIVHRRLVRELHPDVNPGARARFDAVQEAFSAIRLRHTPPNTPGVNAPSMKLDPSGRYTTGAISPTPIDNEDLVIPRRPQVTPAEKRGGASKHSGRDDQGKETKRTGRDDRAKETNQPVTPVVESAGTRAAERQQTSSTRDDTGVLDDTQDESPVASGPSLSNNPLLRRAPIRVERPATPVQQPASPAQQGQPEDRQAQPLPQSELPLMITAIPGKAAVHRQSGEQMLYYLLDLSLAPGIAIATQQLNLMLVLDHSSSMARGDKMTRLREAVARIIDLMAAEDYLGIVMFGDRASILLPSTPLGDKRLARAALDSFRSHGGTEISTGLRLGLHALQNLPGKQVAGIILLTDGQTYGDEAVCLDLAVEARERAVQITPLGLGDDWNSQLMDAIAARSGGQAYYVPTAEALSSVFESQVRTLQRALMHNVGLSLRPVPDCRVLRATWVAPTIAYHTVPSYIGAGQAVELDLGRLSTNRTYRLLIEVVVSHPVAGDQVMASAVCTYDAPTLGIERGTSTCVLGVNFVDEEELEPAVHSGVLDALRKITAYRLQEQAVQAIEDGQTLKGTASLRTAAKHLEDAGHGDLAVLVRAEASRAERVGTTQPASVKRMIYGTRGLGSAREEQ